MKGSEKLRQTRIRISGSELLFTLIERDEETVDELLKCIESNHGIMRKVVKELPKKMNIVVKKLHPLAYNILDVPSEAAAFHHVIKNLKTSFSSNTIWIFPESLQDIKTSSKDKKEFWFSMFSMFLHELAHYLTGDEKEADEIKKKWLNTKPFRYTEG